MYKPNEIKHLIDMNGYFQSDIPEFELFNGLFYKNSDKEIYLLNKHKLLVL